MLHRYKVIVIRLSNTSIIYPCIPSQTIEMPEKKRESTSIKMDPDLWKEAKIEAIRRDIDLSVLVEDSLRKELKKPRSIQ